MVKERWHQKVEATRFPTAAQQMITDESGNSLNWSGFQHPCAQGNAAILMDRD